MILLRGTWSHRLILLLGIVLISGVFGAQYLWAGDAFTVYVSTPGQNAQQITVVGRFNTVADLLAEAGITVSEEDAVVPSLVEQPVPDSPVLVDKALLVTVRTDDATGHYATHIPTLGPFLRDIGVSVRRTDRLFADGRLLSLADLERSSVPDLLEIGRFTNVIIRDGGREIVTRTAGQTVGEALTDAGIRVYAADGVDPAMSQWIVPDLVITVRRSMPLTIRADGRVIQTRSHNTRVLDVLAEAGVGLNGADFTRPGPNTVLSANDTIVVIRVTEDFRTIDEEIPFESQWQATDRFEIDNFGLLQAGVPGIRRQRIRVRYENGVEVAQRLDGEWIAREPLPEVIGFGTNIVTRTLATADGPRDYWRKVRMRVTSYTAATSGKAPDHPAYGITASGLPSGKGIVAVDPRVVPWLSTVYVEGYGDGLAGDTGGGVKGRWIDLGYPEDDYPHWSGYADVYYLTPVPPPDEINYLIPRTLP